MEQDKVLVRKRIWLLAAEMCILLAVATLAPLLGNQYITGTLVNATLILAVAGLGFGGALFVCLLPSLIAVLVGTLPVVLAPMIPFIIAGNVVFAGIFALLGRRNYWLGMLAGAVAKASLLFCASNIIFSLLIKKQLPVNIITMMSYPQLITAVMGGLLAFVIIKAFDAKGLKQV